MLWCMPAPLNGWRRAGHACITIRNHTHDVHDRAAASPCTDGWPYATATAHHHTSSSTALKRCTVFSLRLISREEYNFTVKEKKIFTVNSSFWLAERLESTARLAISVYILTSYTPGRRREGAPLRGPAEESPRADFSLDLVLSGRRNLNRNTTRGEIEFPSWKDDQ